MLVLLSFLFRLPPLLNAPGTNSDAAIVGLQARHLLRGEVAAFLWGSHYQTSVDAFVAAFFFRVVPEAVEPYALMLSTLVGHVALTLLVFATLRRRIGEGRAFVLALALVFTTSPVHTYVLYPPRQAALTLVFAAVAVLDVAAAAHAARRSRRAHALFASGSAVALLAVFADPYALLFLPAVALFAALAAWRGGALSLARLRDTLPSLAAVAVGGVVGAVPFALLVTSANARAGTRGMDLAVVGRNARVLVHDALPWLLGAKVYRGSTVLDYGRWESPIFASIVGYAGAVVGIVLVLAGAVAALVPRGGAPWPTRRLGIFGAVVVPLTLAGFLGSVMVFDLFAARYLVAIALVFPFAVAPLAKRLPCRTLGFAVAPYYLATALGGWVGYGPYVAGPLPTRIDAGSGAPEAEIRAALRSRKIDYAIADYWTAYRLTFLFHETPIVVPLNASEDRYRPYRDAFDGAPRVAYLFDPTRSREDAAATLSTFRARYAVEEELTVAGVRVALLRRRPFTETP